MNPNSSKIEEERFLEAFNLNADSLFRTAFLKVNNRELAKDLVQETCFKTWESIVNNGPIENIRAFMFRVLINLIIDSWKKKKSVQESDLEDGFFDIASDESVFKNAEIKELLVNINNLPDKEKTLLIMRYVEDMAVSEIANILQEKENTITVRIKRAISSLQNNYKI